MSRPPLFYKYGQHDDELRDAVFGRAQPRVRSGGVPEGDGPQRRARSGAKTQCQARQMLNSSCQRLPPFYSAGTEEAGCPSFQGAGDLGSVLKLPNAAGEV
eukprot:9521744-Heterocapsa_arctica.AAC.1